MTKQLGKFYKEVKMIREALSKADKDDFFRELKSLRRKFHKNPETGFAEFWTTAQIYEYLSDLGYDLILGEDLYSEKPALNQAQKKISLKEAAKKMGTDSPLKKMDGRTGVAASLKTGNKGPVIGFRFDIDALPIKESQSFDHRPFKENFASDNGNMHACGHDGHIAIGLGLAKKIRENISDLKGEYHLFFQPAEEISMGGELFSRLEAVKTLDYFFPIHAGLTDAAKMACSVSFMASRRYLVIFKGKNSHAGVAPERGANALLAACEAVGALYGLPRHSEGSSRINVGKFVSDNMVNVISDKTEFILDLRGQNNEVLDSLARQAEDIVRGAALMRGVKAEISFITEAIETKNSPPALPLIKQAGLDFGLKEEEILDHLQIYGSEDATFIMREVSERGGLTSYICFGSNTYGGHHNPEFDFDEEVLLRGAGVLWNLIREIQRR